MGGVDEIDAVDGDGLDEVDRGAGTDHCGSDAGDNGRRLLTHRGRPPPAAAPLAGPNAGTTIGRLLTVDSSTPPNRRGTLRSLERWGAG